MLSNISSDFQYHIIIMIISFKSVINGVALIFISLFSISTLSAEKSAPVVVDSLTGELLLADPTIFTIDDKYYMAGTQSGTPPGFTVFKSDDLLHWKTTSANGEPQFTPGDNVYGSKGFWAPQFVTVNDKVYLFYTANEQVACAVADSIDGTYHAFIPKGSDSFTVKPEPIDDSCGNIDPFLFRDTDGKCYLYHVRFDNGNYIWVGEYDIEKGSIVENSLQPTIGIDQPWEHTRSYESFPIMEGPTVVKIDETYYLFYSANHFMSKDYAVGYATAPTPLGPWTKNPDNPVISRAIIGEPGSGHGDIFTDRYGNLRYVFHTHNSDDIVSPRRTRVISLKTIVSDTPGTPQHIVVDPSTLLKPVLSGVGEIYMNPVINISAPDPTVIRAADGFYYLYATENVPNLPIFKSDDLVNWELTGTAFTDASRPKMVPEGNIWAPDIQYINGRYVLYYSKSKWGGEWDCGIGVAVADNPEGPFTDCGPLFISKEIGVQNSIDPVYFAEGDKKYLFWGSFRGIFAIELSNDGLTVKKEAKPIQIAGTLTEGTNIFKHDDYYYLIGSAGTCCEGERSTYRVVMARSKNLLGPYVDKEGEAAMENNFSLLMNRSKNVIGPGHNANFVTDDAGQFWMLYHGFDAAETEAGRKVYLDRIFWGSDGWPMIEGHQPSERAVKPVISRIGGVR